MRNGRETILTDSMDIKKIIKQYYELYAHKFEWNDNSLKGTNIYKAIYIKEIESITFKLSKKKVLIPDGFTYEFYQTLKEEIIQIIHNIFKKKKK